VTYASQLVPALRGLGHEVFVLTFHTNSTDNYTIDLGRYLRKQSVLDRAMFKVTPKSRMFNRVSCTIAHAIRELVAQHKIEVFEIEESLGWSSTTSRLNLVPVVVRLHGPCFLMGQFDRPRNWYKINQEGKGIKRAHYVTACCAETLQAVRSYYRLTIEKSRIIPNSIDTVCEGEIWRSDQCNKNSLLFVGRFDKVKGGDLAILAFGQLAASLPKLRLTFVGPDRGIETDKGNELLFHEFVHENVPEGLRSRIDFRGQLSHAEVMSLRRQHFLTIIAARYDIQGYMMMEAMSLGCPIVATAVGGIPEFIKDGHNGLLVPSGDASAMAVACKTLLSDVALAVKIGRQAWLDCRYLYNPGDIAQRMVSTDHEAINSANIPQC
jgi:glycosyltransferase involved in cell wall biosynthesis